MELDECHMLNGEQAVSESWKIDEVPAHEDSSTTVAVSSEMLPADVKDGRLTLEIYREESSVYESADSVPTSSSRKEEPDSEGTFYSVLEQSEVTSPKNVQQMISIFNNPMRTPQSRSGDQGSTKFVNANFNSALQAWKGQREPPSDSTHQSSKSSAITLEGHGINFLLTKAKWELREKGELGETWSEPERREVSRLSSERFNFLCLPSTGNRPPQLPTPAGKISPYFERSRGPPSMGQRKESHTSMASGRDPEEQLPENEIRKLHETIEQLHLENFHRSRMLVVQREHALELARELEEMHRSVGIHGNRLKSARVEKLLTKIEDEEKTSSEELMKQSEALQKSISDTAGAAIEIEQLKENLDHLTVELAAVREELANCNLHLHEEKETSERLKAELDRMRTDAALMEKEMETSRRLQEDTEEQLKQQNNVMRNLHKELLEVMMEESRAKEMEGELRTEIDLLRVSKAELEEKCTELETRMRGDMEDMSMEVLEIKTRMAAQAGKDAIVTKMGKLKTELQTVLLQKQFAAAMETSEQLTLQLSEVNHRTDKLAGQLAVLEVSHSEFATEDRENGWKKELSGIREKMRHLWDANAEMVRQRDAVQEQVQRISEHETMEKERLRTLVKEKELENTALQQQLEAIRNRLSEAFHTHEEGLERSNDVETQLEQTNEERRKVEKELAEVKVLLKVHDAKTEAKLKKKVEKFEKTNRKLATRLAEARSSHEEMKKHILDLTADLELLQNNLSNVQEQMTTLEEHNATDVAKLTQSIHEKEDELAAKNQKLDQLTAIVQGAEKENTCLRRENELLVEKNNCLTREYKELDERIVTMTGNMKDLEDEREQMTDAQTEHVLVIRDLSESLTESKEMFNELQRRQREQEERLQKQIASSNFKQAARVAVLRSRLTSFFQENQEQATNIRDLSESKANEAEGHRLTKGLLAEITEANNRTQTLLEHTRHACALKEKKLAENHSRVLLGNLKQAALLASSQAAEKAALMEKKTMSAEVEHSRCSVAQLEKQLEQERNAMCYAEERAKRCTREKHLWQYSYEQLKKLHDGTLKRTAFNQLQQVIHLRKLQSKTIEVTTQINEKENQVNGLKSSMESLERCHRKDVSTAKEFQKRVQELETDVGAYKDELAVVTQRYKSKKDALCRFQTLAARANIRQAACTADLLLQLRSSETDVKDKDNETRQLKKTVWVLEEQTADMKLSKESTMEETVKMKNQVESYKQELASTQLALETTDRQLVKLQTECAGEKSRNAEHVTSLSAQLYAVLEKNKEESARIEELLKMLSEINAAYSAEREVSASAQQNVAKLEARLKSSQHKVTAIQETLSQHEANADRFRAAVGTANSKQAAQMGSILSRVRSMSQEKEDTDLRITELETVLSDMKASFIAENTKLKANETELQHRLVVAEERLAQMDTKSTLFMEQLVESEATVDDLKSQLAMADTSSEKFQSLLGSMQKTLDANGTMLSRVNEFPLLSIQDMTATSENIAVAAVDIEGRLASPIFLSPREVETPEHRPPLEIFEGTINRYPHRTKTPTQNMEAQTTPQLTTWEEAEAQLQRREAKVAQAVKVIRDRETRLRRIVSMVKEKEDELRQLRGVFTELSSSSHHQEEQAQEQEQYREKSSMGTVFVSPRYHQLFVPEAPRRPSSILPSSVPPTSFHYDFGSHLTKPSDRNIV